MTRSRLALLLAPVVTVAIAAAAFLSAPADGEPAPTDPRGEAAIADLFEDRRADGPAVLDPSPDPDDFGTPLPPADGVPEPSRDASPVSLRLPTIDVEDAPIAAVGVERDGAMEIPRAEEVGWYRFGPTPGGEGSAVLAAHIAAEGVDGVFRNLDDLDPGDPFEVVDADGDVQQYLVVGLEEYEKRELPADALFARDGAPRLVLITCGGEFNPQLRSYDSNVVAYALPFDDALLGAVADRYEPDAVIDRWGGLSVD